MAAASAAALAAPSFGTTGSPVPGKIVAAPGTVNPMTPGRETDNPLLGSN
uniref:DEAD-box ATP-dependent RNA helicase 42 n=1 Tax=Rhizophora mucronata TaxID=61149 RepID=A0A2P2QB43_RHIMU